MPRFEDNKALAAILYLAQKKGSMDLYALVKTIYFADKKHLHKWGRTITGDQYVRMEHGPTPSAIYDMLKSVRGDKDWRTDLSGFLRIDDNTVIPLAEPNMEQFSESDLEALDEAYAEHGHKSFSELKRDSHDKAYHKSSEYRMHEEDLAEDDAALIEYIRQRREDERHFEAW